VHGNAGLDEAQTERIASKAYIYAPNNSVPLGKSSGTV
jgi:hypothetical protein|tara:strand:+ start:3735 stop:3848 length:114 start_codon:yes stop_codon:yes gene_type:complete